MKREVFLSYLLKVGGILAITPLLTSCASVYRKSFNYSKKDEKKMRNLSEEVNQILSYAALSPSGHNTQPWMVKVQPESELIIKSDKSRWLPKVDPTNRETFLSISAFVETIYLASLAMGHEANISIIANDFKDIDLFKIKIKRMSSKSIKEAKYLGLLKDRVTTRTNFEKKEIQTDQIEEVLNIAPDHIKYYPLESNEGKWLADNLPEAIKQQSFNNEKQEELSNWMRFSKSEAKERQDGITAEALGMNRMARFVWYNFFNRKSAMGDSFRNKGIDAAKEQVENCSGFLVLTSKSNSLDSVFNCGRLYQKVGLKLTEVDILHHTMSQLLEEEPWTSAIKSNLKLDQPVQFVIRVGYGKSSKPSIRRPVKDFVIA